MIDSSNASALVSANLGRARVNEAGGEGISEAIRQGGQAVGQGIQHVQEEHAKDRLQELITSKGGNPNAKDLGFEGLKAELIRLQGQETSKAGFADAQKAMALRDVPATPDTQQIDVDKLQHPFPTDLPGIPQKTVPGTPASQREPTYAEALRGATTPEGGKFLGDVYKNDATIDRSAALAQRPETTLEKARLDAASREKVAGIGADSRRDVATTRTGAADRRTEVMRQLGERKNELVGEGLDEKAAEAKARDELGLAKLDETTRHHGATEALGADNLDQRKEELENRKSEFTQRMTRVDQRIAVMQKEAAGKIAPRTMQRIIDAREKARIASSNFDTAGADAAMKEAESLIPKEDAAPAPGVVALAATAVDPAAKARFDAMDDAKKAQFLQKATPEQKAQVGR